MPAKKAASTVAKPTYAVMVAESIKALGDRTGSSVQAITKHLQAKYSTDINRPALNKAIKKGVEAGDLVQIKASYKLNKKAPVANKPKKAPVKKVPVAKVVTKKATTVITKKVAPKPKKTITKKASSKKSSTTTTKKAATKKAVPKKTTTKKKTAKK